jgi:hypothetical protein
MEDASEPVIGVDRSQYPNLVATLAELVCQRLYMSEDTARVGVGIGANKSYAHP